MIGRERQGDIEIKGGNSDDTADVENIEGVKSLKVVSGLSDAFTIHLNAANVNATQAFMLVDLSDTTNWPHTNTDHINVKSLEMYANPTSAFRGTISFGFLSSVDATNGDFNVLDCWDMTSKAQDIDVFKSFTLGHFDTELTRWFGPTSANDVLFQTDVNLQGPDGTTAFPSGDGDLVMKLTITAGSIDVCTTLTYETIV